MEVAPPDSQDRRGNPGSSYLVEKPGLSAERLRTTTLTRAGCGVATAARRASAGAERIPRRLRDLVALGSDYRIATVARPVGGQHAASISTSAPGGSSGVASGRSAQSLAGGPARSSRYLCSLHCFECGVAADPNARRLDR
jgi:hypothetical protein